MDELIRELEGRMVNAQRMADSYPTISRLMDAYGGMAQAYAQAATLASEAKRRMADRESAWDLQL